MKRALKITAIGAFLMSKHAARKMLVTEPISDRCGTVLFADASAGAKGFPQSAPFATGSSAQRGLAESIARETGPRTGPPMVRIPAILRLARCASPAATAG